MTDEPSTESFPLHIERVKKGRMQKLMNHIIQLQELSMARLEQEASMPGARLAKLDEAIRSLLGGLPPDVKTFIVRMQDKGMLAIVHISNGVCSGLWNGSARKPGYIPCTRPKSFTTVQTVQEFCTTLNQI